MASNEASEVIRHLRRTVLLRDGADLTDGQLLACFIEQRDETAFAALVRRHGSLVWGVCRRLLNRQDAEDAFQATFLVLVRKASAIVPRERVANWLYGVAYRTALQARRTATRRRAREKQVTEMPEPAVVQQDLWRDLQPLLDQELSRLPDVYREVIVLCDLEGKTRKEVARQIGLAEGTVGSRLARARTMLAKRLAQRGVALSGGALAAVLSQKVALAGVPNSVVSSTIKAAGLLTAGTAATGAISVKVAALTEGVMKAMLFAKLRTAIAVVLILGFLATGATLLTYRTAAGQDDKKPDAEKPVEPAAKQEKEKEAFTAWGDEQPGGVQVGLGYLPGERRSYRTGEIVTLVVRVRNIGKQDANLEFMREYLQNSPPKIVDGKGKEYPRPTTYNDFGSQTPEQMSLSPGKESELYKLKFVLRPASEKGNRDVMEIYGTGKFQIQETGLLGNSWTGKTRINTTFSGMFSGRLELEVKEAEKQEKEAFTAWGKEVGGLQAGLGYKPGEHRAYRTGETVTLVVRVRNVGKKAVRFSYFNEDFSENPPVVKDDKGRPLSPIAFNTLSGWPTLNDVNLASGKEVNLCEMTLVLAASEKGKERRAWTLYGTGKFQLKYDKVGGKITQKNLELLLSKLATGKLELEVKDAEKLPGKEEKEGFTAWGKEVGGLQAGLGFRPGERRAYHHGETVTLVVRVRNVGKQNVQFQCSYPYFAEIPPAITDSGGKPFVIEKVTTFGLPVLDNVELAAGKAIQLAELKFNLKPASENGVNERNLPGVLKGTGKFQIHYGQLAYEGDLGRLATGTLELEIKPAPPPAQGFVPAPEGPVMEKAIYLVGKQGGELPADDLKKHPEVKTVHTFADLQRFAGKGKAVWIDVTAIPLLGGEKEQEWVIRKAQEEYTFAVIGCNEFLCCFRDKLDCFGISGPGPIDWTKYDLSPGFSVLRQSREKVGKEVHVTGNGRGYQVVPTVQKVLNVTDRLLAGEAAPNAP